MLISVIVPSYNQEEYIRITLENLTELKLIAPQHGINIEIILPIKNVTNILSVFEASETDLIIESESKDRGNNRQIKKE